MKIATTIFLIFFHYSLVAQPPGGSRVQILYSPGAPVNSFIPSKVIGGAIDGHGKGDIVEMLSKQSIGEMHKVGLKPLSYRLRTELGNEAWHWNPIGRWSEKNKKQGYWISDSTLGKDILISNGYRLPRRGNTVDHANDDGYSRLDDRDISSFWKSNPYLDEYFTGEPDSLHPQWAIFDLGKSLPVNALKIKWGNPYAASFSVGYAADMGAGYFEPYQPGLWHDFPKSIFHNSSPNEKLLTLSGKEIKLRYLRITMIQSKYSGPEQMNDTRDRIGFSIREVEIGSIDKAGKFHDYIKHSSNGKKQSRAYVSSTDPWHRAVDLDPEVEQAGIDLFFKSRLTLGEPVIMPVGLLYDSPENMQALAIYLQLKKYPVTEMEMGEEPEGQLIAPVDYAALYYQWAKKIKAVSPGIHLGGPGFATLAFQEEDDDSFTEAKWTSMFLDYLRKNNAIDLFNFFSFEWYPFDNMCDPSSSQLLVAPQMLENAFKKIRKILPDNIPVYLSEYGYSAYSGTAEVSIEGALMYADILCKFLELGGNKNFLYGYEPAYLEAGCDGYGNNILFGLNSEGKIGFKTAAFYGMQMLVHDWAQPADSVVEMYPVKVISDKNKNPPLSAYAIKKPGGGWSVALINKDPRLTWNVNVEVENIASGKTDIFYPKQIIQYSGKQYQWLSNRINGHPRLTLPPIKKTKFTSSKMYLPPYSLTIVDNLNL